MATYNCFTELQDKVLKLFDRVILEHDGFDVEFKFEFKVESFQLAEINRNFHFENKIFHLLGLDAWEFCEQHYTKLPNGWEHRKRNYPNFWPIYRTNDYESITKVVLELFRLIEEQKQLKETSETLFID